MAGLALAVAEVQTPPQVQTFNHRSVKSAADIPPNVMAAIFPKLRAITTNVFAVGQIPTWGCSVNVNAQPPMSIWHPHVLPILAECDGMLIEEQPRLAVLQPSV